MDIRAYNRQAWDAEVARGNRWTVPVDRAVIDRARAGEWQVVLTPSQPVPRTWFPEVRGCRILGLAAAGGQQGPILAAAGAEVTVFDNSPAQLQQDRTLAERCGLALRTVEGDMRDLGAFESGAFDVVFNPCSLGFVPDIAPVWAECARVLRPGGILMTGLSNPALFIFDGFELEAGRFVVRHRVPFDETTDLTPQERQHYIDRNEPLMFGHTLDQQVGEQLRAGFTITDLFEDGDPDHALNAFIPTYFATRAVLRPATLHGV